MSLGRGNSPCTSVIGRGNSPFSVRTDVTGFLVVALAKLTSATAGTMIGLAITRGRENKSASQSDRLAELEHKQDEKIALDLVVLW